jgi:hypothetical protein
MEYFSLYHHWGILCNYCLCLLIQILAGSDVGGLLCLPVLGSGEHAETSMYHEHMFARTDGDSSSSSLVSKLIDLMAADNDEDASSSGQCCSAENKRRDFPGGGDTCIIQKDDDGDGRPAGACTTSSNSSSSGGGGDGVSSGGDPVGNVNITQNPVDSTVLGLVYSFMNKQK